MNIELVIIDNDNNENNNDVELNVKEDKDQEILKKSSLQQLKEKLSSLDDGRVPKCMYYLLCIWFIICVIFMYILSMGENL